MLYHTLQGCLLKPEDHTLEKIFPMAEPQMETGVSEYRSLHPSGGWLDSGPTESPGQLSLTLCAAHMWFSICDKELGSMARALSPRPDSEQGQKRAGQGLSLDYMPQAKDSLLAAGSDPSFPHHFMAHGYSWDRQGPGRRGQLTTEEEALWANDAHAQMTLD